VRRLLLALALSSCALQGPPRLARGRGGAAARLPGLLNAYASWGILDASLTLRPDPPGSAQMTIMIRRSGPPIFRVSP
jgi:hypothetical protein